MWFEVWQPSRRGPDDAPGNDAIAPDHRQSGAQDWRLAQLYVLASARAGARIAPGFHANVDRGIRDAHDDLQPLT